jgi:hypothetical protein
MKKDHLTRAIGALFFLSLLVWAFRFIGHFPAFADTLEYVFPEKWFNVESFQKGLLPLWNPYVACGQPHLANFQSAVFYPPFWIWGLTGLANWFFFMPLAHSLWAALGFFLWMRENQAEGRVSALCAVSYGVSAMAALYWGFPTHMAAYAWVPWVFFAALRCIHKPSPAAWAGVVLCWSLQLLAGYPYFSLYTTLFLAFWVWKEKPGWKPALALGAALGAGLAMTSAHWLPFVDFLGYLRREGWQDPVYCLRWINLLTLLSPNILGIPGTQSYWGDYPNFIFGNLYLGLAPLGLLLLGFGAGGKKGGKFWSFCALAVVVWMAGVYFPLWKLLPQRFLETFEPTKAAFLFVFCALTAAGKTWTGLKEKQIFYREDAKTRRKTPFWIWVLGVLWLMDALAVPYRVLHLVEDPYRNPQVAQAAEGVKRLAGGSRLVSLRSQEKLYSTNVHDLESSMMETATTLRPNTQEVWGIPSSTGYLSIYVDGYQNLQNYIRIFYPFEGRVLDAAGAKVLVLPDRLPAFKYKLAYPQGPVYDIQNAGAMGTAWETDQVREFPDRPSVFLALLDPRAFLEDQVFTEKSREGKAVRLPPAGRTLSGDAPPSLQAQITGFFTRLTGKVLDIKPDIQGIRPGPCETMFEVNTARPGYLVFDESFAPGWRAWCDGKPESIFRAYGYWMAALVPEAGAHRVEFRYEPVAVRLGIFLSLIFGALFAAGYLEGKKFTVTPGWVRTSHVKFQSRIPRKYKSRKS